MTPAARGRLRAQLEELIAKWQKHSDQILNGLRCAADPAEVRLEFEAASRIYRACAKDVAALLGVQQDDEQQQNDDEKDNDHARIGHDGDVHR